MPTSPAPSTLYPTDPPIIPATAASQVDGAGWSAYFCYGHSSDRFDTISAYATERLALFIGKRHKSGRRGGLSVLAYRVPDRCGLIRLSGIVVAPRANKPWRERPNAGGERRR